MAAMKSKQFEEDASVKVHRIRITLTSRNVKNLEKGAWRRRSCTQPALLCRVVAAQPHAIADRRSGRPWQSART